MLSFNTFAQTSPQQTLEEFLDTMRAMQFPVQDASAHQALVQKADGYLDLSSMGRKAMQDHWSFLTPEQQANFTSLFIQLIQKTAYPRSHDFIGKLKITFPEITPDSTGTIVKSIVHASEDGLNAEVIYHLSQKDGQWKVDDVILDDVSIVEDLKYQFNKIMDKSQFNGLIETMQKKLSAAENPSQGANAA